MPPQITATPITDPFPTTKTLRKARLRTKESPETRTGAWNAIRFEGPLCVALTGKRTDQLAMLTTAQDFKSTM